MTPSSDIIKYCYISNISCRNLRNIKDFDVKIGCANGKPCHLLITGDNGVGKTTFVRSLYEGLKNDEGGKPLRLVKYLRKDRKLDSCVELLKNERDVNSLVSIKKYLSDLAVIPDCLSRLEYYAAVGDGDFLVFNFEANRKENFVTPDGPRRMDVRATSKQFIQMLVNLKTQSAFANQDNNHREVEKIEGWFARFNEALAELLGHNDFKLEFKSKEFNFEIKERDKEPYKFTQLSDGYSAILMMLAEIMLNMSTDPVSAYDMPGIVIIDEIETHLHVELQKKILPFMTKFFPNLQFVVTTHSPFVLSSVSNAVIYDLGTHQKFEDFSKFSYGNIIEGYYNESTYSNVLLSQLDEIQNILNKDELTDEEKRLIAKFDREMDDLSAGQPLELQNKWLTLKIKNIGKF